MKRGISQGATSPRSTPATSRFDSAQDGVGLGVDLVDPAGTVRADPERPLGPGQARIAALARRRDRGQDGAGGGIDLVDARCGDLDGAHVWFARGESIVGFDEAIAGHVGRPGLARALANANSTGQFTRPLVVAELGHGDAAQRQSRRVITQRDAFERTEEITACQ
jgi:hypothetical protein